MNPPWSREASSVTQYCSYMYVLFRFFIDYTGGILQSSNPGPPKEWIQLKVEKKLSDQELIYAL